jgi:hypothetical protein
MTTKPRNNAEPISGVSMTLEHRSPSMLIDGQLVELPPESAEYLARCLRRAMRKASRETQCK